jgi:phosphoglycolate phosphatase-like HAD superfamily hydrolase
VGDSPEDVTMARHAGVFALGVPGGYPNRTALEESAPDAFAESLTLAADVLIDRFSLGRSAR